MENIEIIIGTYESLILGYRVVNKLDGNYGLEASFTEDFNKGSLKCVYVSPNGILVSSGTDDSVRLHNLVKRKDLGQLFQHTGSVNSIAFYKRSHMFTASEDGTICMWKSRNWEMIRTLKGHKSQVMSVAVHPSGKLGLSVGSDRSLLTWDFTTGKLAFQRKIKEAAQNIMFTSCGSYYILVYLKKIEVCSLEDTKTVQEIPTSWRINGTCFVTDKILAIGGDNRYVLLVDILTGKNILTLDMATPGEDSFSSRVRSICVTVCEGQTLVVAATASGNVKVFKVNLFENTADVMLFYEAKVRVTCMALHNSLTDSRKEEEMSEVKEVKQVKKLPVPKPLKRNLDTEADEDISEDEQESDGEDSGDDGKKLPKQQKLKSCKVSGDTSVEDVEKVLHQPGKKFKKMKTQKSSQPQNKKRKLLAAETEKSKTQSPMSKEKTASSSRVPQSSEIQSKKLKKKKKLQMK